MRTTHYRDWIAWSLVAAIAVVAATEIYARQHAQISPSEYAYKIIVTPEHTSH